MSSNFLIYKDDSEKYKNILTNIKNNNNISLGKEIKEIYSSSNAIKNISPSLIIHLNDEKKTIFQKFNINNEEILKEFNINSVKDSIPKFEKIQTENNENNSNSSENEENEEDEYEILENENIEEDPRLDLDKENLLKGFKFGMDPFDMNIKFSKNKDEDDENNKYNIEFKSLQENLQELFDIQLK